MLKIIFQVDVVVSIEPSYAIKLIHLWFSSSQSSIKSLSERESLSSFQTRRTSKFFR